jgi:hypothetical protein
MSHSASGGSASASDWDAVRHRDPPPPGPTPTAAAHLRGGGHHSQHHGDGGGDGENYGNPVEDHEDFTRYPPVKSPFLSRWAGLGYGQGQIGENFLLMAQYDKPGAMRSVLAPMLSPGVARCTSLCAALAPFVVGAQLAAASADSAPLSDLGTLVVIVGVLAFFCCGTASLLPDPGISVNFRMLDDGITALHVAAQHGSLAAARMLVAEGAAIEIGDADGRTALHHAGKEAPFLRHLYTNASFYQDRLGTNIGKTQKRRVAFS